MSPISVAESAMPWLVVGWMVTIVVVAALLYLIVRAVLRKTEPQTLPDVLSALGPLLGGIARALAQRPSAASVSRVSPLGAKVRQTGKTASESDEETA